MTILALTVYGIDRERALAYAIVLYASDLHSRRVLMTFRKRGFTNVTVVSDYTAHARLPYATRKEVSSLREWSAIAVCWWQGQL